MVNGDEFTNMVYNEISNHFKKNKKYVKGKDEVNSIVIFDEPILSHEKSRYKIAYSKIIIFENNEPFLAIEAVPHKPTPPKDIAGNIPIYMITRKIVINMKNGRNEEYVIKDNSNFNLLIVVPNQPEGNKSAQISDLNEKFKGIFDLNNEYTNLKNFEICELDNIDNALNKFK